MDSDYLAILAPAEGGAATTPPKAIDALRAMGMIVRHTSGAMTLFGKDDMPMLPLPDGGVLIGHLFTREGTAVTRSTVLCQRADSTQIRERVLKGCWGSYLLLQPCASDPAGFVVTRSPSAAGNVPCFYSIRRGSGFLTSDVSLAVRSGLYKKQIDWDVIRHRLRYPGIKTQRTALTGLLELLPGCLLTTSGTDNSVRQAWSPWNFVDPKWRYPTLRDAADQIREAITGTVHAWANEDQAILLELSGGLDSSIVAACLRDCHTRVTCYNLTTPVPGVDEREYARQMARQLGVELHVHQLDLDEARFDFTPPAHAVNPCMGPLQHAVNTAMETAAERYGATSYYSGGGGDSIFCYLRTAAPAADACKALGFRAGLTAIGNLASLHQCTLWKAGRLSLSKLRRPPRSPFQEDTTFLALDAADVGREAHPWFMAPADALPGDRERIFDLAGNQLFENQAPRGSSRPLRFPLLSQPVMEACLRAPSWMWITGGRNRAVARSAFSGLLPPDIVNRQSKATYMSYLGAVYERNKQQIANFLLAGRLQSQGLLDASALGYFLPRPLPPRDQRFLRIFELCMVENWVRHQF